MNTSTSPSRRRPTGAGTVMLAAAGLLAGLATASCCALPILLASLGLGSAWLFRLAVVAAPHRTALLIIGAAAIATAALLLLRRRTQVCETGALCAKPGVQIITSIGLAIGVILLVAGYVYV
jgi:mercuric ion transport protein